ncbi:spondin domain-containing protein [Methyloversatilis thermotolerans]|uniref:spondin domain-containing protein n=1 Tax=Methyloversatilis thermotolerans TaxID=1346290 RepID=UPI000399AE0F|nr:spondin domain-containing protein [Methyloversatilis thermotolerans]
MNTVLRMSLPLLAGAVTLAMPLLATAADVRVTFTNVSPAGSVGTSPLWVGFHNTSFDLFDAGSAASLGVERIAEDGNTAPLSTLFAATTETGIQGTLPEGPAFPGAVRSLEFTGLDLAGDNRWFSYASMVVLSNDFFIGNDNAMEHDLSVLLSNGGMLSFYVGGNGDVWDAGTEVNDFANSLANGAFGIGGGQSMANQGMAENGVVRHVDDLPYASFLSAALVPAGYDFTPLQFTSLQAIGRIDIQLLAPVPEPDTYAMLLGGLAIVGAISRRAIRRRTA